MAKPELGAKRQCESCATKFFDLNRNPIKCPKCGAVFQAVAARAERVTVKPEAEEEEAAATPGVELVSLDEVAAAEEKEADPVGDDVGVDDGAGEDTFLEAEEEDDADVADLIDGDLAGDEEP